jgi:hypothetical protein
MIIKLPRVGSVSPSSHYKTNLVIFSWIFVEVIKGRSLWPNKDAIQKVEGQFKLSLKWEGVGVTMSKTATNVFDKSIIEWAEILFAT